jgi:hypothetical protein
MHGSRHFIRHVPIARANRRGKGDVVQAAVNNIIRAAGVEAQVGDGILNLISAYFKVLAIFKCLWQR